MKNLPTAQKPVVQSYLNDILNYGDSMPGDVYQKTRSRLSTLANGMTTDADTKGALTGIYKALDRAFDRSAGPDAAQAMAAAREQWGNSKTIAKLSNPSGDISPARLATNYKNLRGDAQDLSQLGLRMKSLPDSGTAQRLLYQGLISGGIGAGADIATGDPLEAAKWAGGAFAAPWLASQALTRAPLRQYLTKGMLNVSPEIEKAIQRIGAAPAGLLGQRIAQ